MPMAIRFREKDVLWLVDNIQELSNNIRNPHSTMKADTCFYVGMICFFF